jgi:biopolymer transport protein ExbD
MKFKARGGPPPAEGDMTSMIDMTFQLIAFFMVLINFSDAETDDRIKLPVSELAKPPEAAFDSPLTVQLTQEGNVLFNGDEIPVQQFGVSLAREATITRRLGNKVENTTVIVRAHEDARAGVVQELIQLCQEHGFEKFALRAMQKEG